MPRWPLQPAAMSRRARSAYVGRRRAQQGAGGVDVLVWHEDERPGGALGRL